MAQLHTLFYSPCSSSASTIFTSIPPNFTYTSSYSSYSSLSVSSLKPNISLSLHRQFRRVRCSILTVENPSSDNDGVVVVDDENEAPSSTTRLLAQNVPWSSTADDMRALFQQFGTVVDVELSMHNKTRNRGLAFVEMSTAEEAAEAFAKLEGFEYEGRTLKMSYAKPKKNKTPPPVKSTPPVVYNLFVANLPFEARAKDLKEFFQSGGSEPVSSEVIFQDTPRKSSGYGFVSFKTKKEADEVLSSFEGKELLGRPIRLARSKKFVKLESEINSQTEEEPDLSTDSSQGSDQPEARDM
ncbi:28 kDa ribonucleoprotein, chloroplastic-like [Silene latifolia]|uniref:28 kDa ribonucleoprotein, chloroplastic-like n=1 Tax=Silene latifolia TaxID=37657 RepID=UPI003D77539B